jgi:hypothetical protein
LNSPPWPVVVRQACTEQFGRLTVTLVEVLTTSRVPAWSRCFDALSTGTAAHRVEPQAVRIEMAATRPTAGELVPSRVEVPRRRPGVSSPGTLYNSLDTIFVFWYIMAITKWQDNLYYWTLSTIRQVRSEACGHRVPRRRSAQCTLAEPRPASVSTGLPSRLPLCLPSVCSNCPAGRE